MGLDCKVEACLCHECTEMVRGESARASARLPGYE